MKKTMLLPTQKVFASFASILVLFSSFTSYIQQPVYAQEATDSAQVSEVTPSPSPTIMPTQMPQKEIDEAAIKEPDVKGVQTKMEESPINQVLEESAPRQTESSSRMKRATRIHDLTKTTYKQSESIVIRLEKDPENDLVATMISKEGKRTEVPLIEHLKNRSSGTARITPTRQITPGAYTLEIKDSQGETANYPILWGVLAINTNKSVYTPGEKAQIAIAVLDKKGEMVCDADVTLKIKNPKGETKELSTKDGIEVTDVCTKKLFTMEPDYKTEYQIADEGVYAMDLTAKTNDGSYSIQDSFRVSASVPFDVERSAPTRTYPIGPYPVTLTVTARENFKGRVTDLVPDSFDIAQQETKEGMSPVLNYVGVESRSETIDETSTNVLGASTSSIVLSKPFEGDHSVTLGYGDEYHAEGLVDMISNALRLEGHEGIDFDMPKGTPVLAAAEGKIIIAGEHDYGLTVTIQHDWGKTYYGHLSEVLVKEGDEVKVGQEIARSGSSGESTGPHLHFGVKPNGSDVGNGYQGMVDPREYLPDLQNSAVLGATTKASSLVKEISWDVDVKKGETVRLGYQFVSPPDSPRLYLLGKARFSSDEKDIFQEERQWQVAVDALSTVVDGTSSLGTTFSGQRKVVRTTHGTNGNRTFVVGVSAAATISLYYTDDPDATTPSWTTVGNVSTSLYESADMEWDSTNSVLYIVYGRNTPVDANTSDIKYKMVTDLGGTPTLGTERDALAASASLNYTHPLVTIAQDSSITKVFVFATGRTDTANPARISLRTGTINSDNPTWDTLYNVKTWTATANSGNVSLARMNTDKTVLFYHNNTDLLATRHDDSTDAQATSGWDALDGTDNSQTTISADDPGGYLLGSSVGHSSSNTMWFAWLDSANDINTRYWNGSSLDTEMVPVALAATTVGPSLSLSADNATLYMTYQSSADATILVYQSRSASDGTTSWGGSETTIEDHSETLTYPSTVERLTSTKMDLVYTTATAFLIRHAQPFAPSYAISGSVKASDESSFIGNPPCDGSTEVVSLRVNGGTASTAKCDASTGAYSFSGVNAYAGDTILIYLNSSSTPKANTVLVSDEATHSDVDLYSGAIIVRDDQDGTITSADMVDYDNDQNATDMLFDAETSTTFVDTDASSELHVWTGDTFAPGGAVTISGSLHNAGTMTWSTHTTTFDATNSGNYLSGTLNGSSGFYKVIFNGSGGEWTIKDAILFSKANGSDTLTVTAGTVTLGDGNGDNAEVMGTFTISSGATFQTIQNLAQGSTITIHINSISNPTTLGCPSGNINCVIALSGTLKIGRNTTLSLNQAGAMAIPPSTANYTGIDVTSTGYLEVKGTQDDTGVDTGTDDSTLRETKICANESYGNDDHNNKAVRMVDGLARGRIYSITDTIASDGDCATGTDDSLVRTTTASSTDTNPTVSCSGNKCVLTMSTEAIVTAADDFIGRYIHDITGTEGYYLIVDSTETGTDTITVIGDPSTLAVATGDDVFVSDGVRSGDSYQILDFATVTSGTANNAYIHHQSGSESVIKYAEISKIGAELANKYGVNFQSIDGSTSGIGASISYSYIHDSHRSIRFDSSSHVNRSYTVQGEQQGVMYNYIKDATQDGVNASGSGSNSVDIIGNRIETVAGNDDCIVTWTGAKNLIVDNILTTCDPGIYMDTSGGNYVVNNKVYNSAGAGIAALGNSSKNLLVGNSVFGTGGAGIHLTGSTATTTHLVGNTVDVAATSGLHQENTTASTIIAANESYGNYVGNTTSDVQYAAAAHTGRFYNSKFGSSTEVSGITTTNAYLASWKHDQTSSATSIWNDFTVPTEVAETPQTEGTAKFNYADALWNDSFTPSMLTGTGTQDDLEFSFSGGTLGGSANQYAYAARCKQTDCSVTTTNAWDVYRDGVDIGDADTGTQFTDATTNVRFDIDDNGDNYARGDLYLFAAYQDSADTNSQKAITMMQTNDVLSVDSGETIQLIGALGNETLIQKDAGATNYAFQVAGGTINANYYKFTGINGNGLSITSGTVTNLSNGTFDDSGGTGASDVYMLVAGTVLDATGPQTWTGMVFDEGTTDSNVNYNVILAGDPVSCTNQWTFESSGAFGGATNGEANDNDTDGSCSGVGYLKWSDPSSGGPTTDQQMRHGKWFDAGVEQGFTF